MVKATCGPSKSEDFLICDGVRAEDTARAEGCHQPNPAPSEGPVARLEQKMYKGHHVSLVNGEGLL